MSRYFFNGLRLKIVTKVGESEAERATKGFAPTTPIIGRRQVAADRAAAALAAAAAAAGR